MAVRLPCQPTKSAGRAPAEVSSQRDSAFVAQGHSTAGRWHQLTVGERGEGFSYLGAASVVGFGPSCLVLGGRH